MNILMSQHSECAGHGNGSAQILRNAEHELDSRKSILLLLAGLAMTFALFVSLPFTQIISGMVAPQPTEIGPIALPPPLPFVEPIKPEPVKPDDVPTPELEKEIQKIPLDLLTPVLNPSGTAIRGFTWNPSDVIKDDLAKIFDDVELDSSPVPIHTVSPVVPFREQSAGTVVLEFVVTPLGNVTQMRVISSTRREFERPAMVAVEQWRFEPGMKDGTRVSSRVRLPIRFNGGD